MNKKDEFFDKLSEELEKLFPKHQCQERSQALVLFAMANIYMREALKKQRKEMIDEIEKELEPFVSKPSRLGEEELYQIKKTLCDEIWAKQRDKLKNL